MGSCYPSEWEEVVDVTYLSSLHLTRSIDAVRGRRGEDAEYVVNRPYFAEVTLRSGDRKDVHKIEVPSRFLTDLASVPPLARMIVSRVGPHLEASVVHDWLYVAWQIEGSSRNEDMRKFADDVFLIAMEKARVKRWKRRLIYSAVRWFGWYAFYGREDRIFIR